jgi:hypothetical protein
MKLETRPMATGSVPLTNTSGIAFDTRRRGGVVGGRARAARCDPVVGFIGIRSPTLEPDYEGFVRGLTETGFINHRNVIIDHRSGAEVDDLPDLAIGLVRDKVAIVCGPTNAIIAARAESDEGAPVR